MTLAAVSSFHDLIRLSKDLGTGYVLFLEAFFSVHYIRCIPFACLF
jgi:hypothetical protein